MQPNQSYQSLSLLLTCGRLLLISCCSNISISCLVGPLVLTPRSAVRGGCLGRSGQNLTDSVWLGCIGRGGLGACASTGGVAPLLGGIS